MKRYRMDENKMKRYRIDENKMKRYRMDETCKRIEAYKMNNIHMLL